MIKLSDEQEEIVFAKIGISIQVLASAGAGKTRVLTERIRHILKSTQKDGVIAVTFTNKAAEEISTRLSDFFDLSERCWISTIHSVAQRILENYGHTIGLPVNLQIYERDQDRKQVFFESLRNENIDMDNFLNVTDKYKKKERERVIQDLFESFSTIKRNFLTDEDILIKYNDKDILRYYRAYQKALLEANGIDYDDILFFAHKILLEQPWCANIYQSKYKHLLIDESQDLNKAQYEFIKTLCGTAIKSIMMVGDPNQMIYGFNDSSERYFTEEFLKDFNPKLFSLTKNYRSSISVIDAANKIKPNSQSTLSYVLKGKMEIAEYKSELVEAESVCKKISELVGQKSEEIEDIISYSNIVIIARTRFSFNTLIDQLKSRNIPFFIKKSERQEEPRTSIGKIFDYSFKIKLNSKNWVVGKKLCQTLLIPYLEDYNLENIISSLNRQVDIQSEISYHLLSEVNKLEVDNPNMMKLFNTIRKIIIDEANDMMLLEKENIIKEIDHFQLLWRNFKVKGLGNSLASFSNALSLGQLYEEEDKNGITLSTVHTMKGLEKDIVFIISMCEGVFPDYRATTEIQTNEELNNMYVAITRSKRWLFMSYPRFRTMPWGDVREQVPSRYIKLLENS